MIHTSGRQKGCALQYNHVCVLRETDKQCLFAGRVRPIQLKRITRVECRIGHWLAKGMSNMDQGQRQERSTQRGKEQAASEYEERTTSHEHYLDGLSIGMNQRDVVKLRSLGERSQDSAKEQSQRAPGATLDHDIMLPSQSDKLHVQQPTPEQERLLIPSASSQANEDADTVAGAQADAINEVGSPDDSGVPATRQGTQHHANVPQQAIYWTQIAPLVECLPHLRILPVDHQSRYPAIGKVVRIDDVRGTSLPQAFKSWSSDHFSRRAPGWGAKIQRLKTGLPADLVTRSILVEDLSDQLIEALGSTFSLDPDVFAEHLARAAHYKDDHDDVSIQPPVDLTIRPIHASLKWFRPRKHNPKLSEWLEQPAMLLDEREFVSRLDHKAKIERGISWLDRARETLHLVTPDTNIFRRSWDLSEASIALEDFAATNLTN